MSSEQRAAVAPTSINEPNAGGPRATSAARKATRPRDRLGRGAAPGGQRGTTTNSSAVPGSKSVVDGFLLDSIGVDPYGLGQPDRCEQIILQIIIIRNSITAEIGRPRKKAIAHRCDGERRICGTASRRWTVDRRVAADGVGTNRLARTCETSCTLEQLGEEVRRYLPVR
jgi:hypothetical protein